MWSFLGSLGDQFTAGVTLGAYSAATHECRRPINMVLSTGDDEVPSDIAIERLQLSPPAIPACAVQVTRVADPSLGHWSLAAYAPVFGSRMPWVRQQWARASRRR